MIWLGEVVWRKNTIGQKSCDTVSLKTGSVPEAAQIQKSGPVRWRLPYWSPYLVLLSLPGILKELKGLSHTVLKFLFETKICRYFWTNMNLLINLTNFFLFTYKIKAIEKTHNSLLMNDSWYIKSSWKNSIFKRRPIKLKKEIFLKP